MEFEIKINERLSLKLRKPEDAEEFFRLVDKNRVTFREYLAWVDMTTSPEDVEEFILKCKKGFEEKTSADFGVKYEGKWVGSMGFHDIDMTHEKAAIGYWLDLDYQGKGIMTECVKAIIKYGFEELKLNRIEIECEANNSRSKAIPEKLGFTLEGKIRANHKINGTYQDDLLFSLLRNEYQV